MNAKNRILDIDMERYVLGELPADRMAAVKAAVEADPAAQARVSALKAENEAILESYPVHLTAVAIREKAAAADAVKPSRMRLLIPAVSFSAAAAAVALALVVMPDAPSVGSDVAQTPPSSEYVGIKGEPSLFIFRQGEKAPLRRGSVAGAGDTLRLKYAPKGATYGVIFSVDGRGTTTLHFPSDASGSTRLEKTATALPYAYQLDDAPDFERFFIVSSDRPIEVREVLSAGEGVGRSGALKLPKGLRAAEFVLNKR